MKSYKMPYIIYADIQSLIKKLDGRGDNPENFSKTKIGGHIPCRLCGLLIVIRNGKIVWKHGP